MAGEIDNSSGTLFLRGHAAFGLIYQSAIGLNNIQTHKWSNVFQFFCLFCSYKTAVQGLGINEEHVVKLVPNRIFSLTFHPAKYKTLLFAGDKWGNLGIWDVVRILIITSEEFSSILY